MKMVSLQSLQSELQKCPAYSRPDLLQTDLVNFKGKCPAADISVVGVAEPGQPKTNCIQLRGKIPIQVDNKERPIGFKFILPTHYPMHAPYVYLDEPFNQSIVEYSDYIDKTYRITSDLLNAWTRQYQPQKHHLIAVLSDVYTLYRKAPPVDPTEM